MATHDPAEFQPGQLAALLRFYADAGVDCLIDEMPHDRFVDSEAARASRPGPIVTSAEAQPSAEPGARAKTASASGALPAAGPGSGRVIQSSPTPAIAVPDEAAITDARAAARQATSLEELRAALDAFTGCNLRHSARNTVFADGNPDAAIMFVGEAPGREEDIQGLPFIGKAGQMLDRMLNAIGLDRTSAYITNMIFWRPPGNRTPTAHELALCRPFTERHIELIDPKIVVFLGNVSSKGMLETTRGILSLRGTWSDYAVGERVYPALPTLHPAYLLRNPAHKKLAWKDFLSLRARMDEMEIRPRPDIPSS